MPGRVGGGAPPRKKDGVYGQWDHGRWMKGARALSSSGCGGILRHGGSVARKLRRRKCDIGKRALVLVSWIRLDWIVLTAAHAPTPRTGSQAAAYGCKIANLFLFLVKTVSFEPIMEIKNLSSELYIKRTCLSKSCPRGARQEVSVEFLRTHQ